MKHDVNIETSSAFDIDLILHLYKAGKIDKDRIIVHNGYKTDDYLIKMNKLQEMGFKNTINVLDSMSELDRMLELSKDSETKFKIGIRMSINEEAQSAYYTSRLGIPHKELKQFFVDKVRDNERVELKMLHFFVDSGIKDTPYYWGEFQKALKLYIELKKGK